MFEKLQLRKYTSQIKKPSEAFKTFLNDYFTGHPMIRGRGEEDTSVWIRMNDQEIKVASQMILDNLGHDSAYIKAVACFRDERAIPILENLVENLDNRFCYEKLVAARVLFDWINYDKYFSVLADTLPKSGEYTKTSLYEWIRGINKETAIHYIFMLLEDKNSFVRWCAYGAFLGYFELGKSGVCQNYEETKFYTSEEVYANKNLFQERIAILKKKIE